MFLNHFLPIFLLFFSSLFLFAQEGEQKNTTSSPQIYINLDVKEKSLSETLDLLRQQTGAEIHLEDEIQKKITLNLVDVAWPEALYIIAEEANCEVSKVSNSSWIIHKSPLVSIEFQDADIRMVIRIISKVAKVKIECSEDVQGYLSIRLKEVLWFEALTAIAKTVDPSYRVIRKSRREAHVLTHHNTMTASESVSLTLDVRNKDIHEIVAYIREQTGANIVVDPSITSKVTVTLKDVPWLEALSIIAEKARCELTKVSDIMWRISQSPVVSIQFQDADLRKVINTIATVANVNVVYSKEVQGRVDVNLKDVPWRKALETVVRSANPPYEISTISRNVLRVVKTKNRISFFPASTSSNSSTLLEKGEIMLDVKGVNVHEVLKSLRKQTEDRIFIHPSIQNPITLSLKNVSLKSALFEIAKQVECEVLAMEGNSWAIRPMLRINLKMQSNDAEKIKKIWTENDKIESTYSENAEGGLDALLEGIPWSEAAKLIERAREEGFQVEKSSNGVFLLRYRKGNEATPVEEKDDGGEWIEEKEDTSSTKESLEKKEAKREAQKRKVDKSFQWSSQCRFYKGDTQCLLESNGRSDFCPLHFALMSQISSEEEILRTTMELMDKLKNTRPKEEFDVFISCIISLNQLFEFPIKVEWIQEEMKKSFSLYEKIREAYYGKKDFKNLINISLKMKAEMLNFFLEEKYQKSLDNFERLRILIDPIKEKSSELQIILKEAGNLAKKSDIHLRFLEIPMDIGGVIWIEKYPEESTAIINGKSRGVDDYVGEARIILIRKGEVLFSYRGENIVRKMVPKQRSR